LEVLTVSVGPTALALAPSQIEQIAQWPQKLDFAVFELGAALRSSRVEPAAAHDGRVLICRDGRGGHVGFVVPAQLSQKVAAPADVYRLPRVLERLKPPPWLQGILLLDHQVTLICDLLLLASLVERA
jgi:hypothetical protein